MKTKSLLSLSILLSLLLSSCLKDKVEVSYSFYTDEEYQLLSTNLNLPNENIDYQVNLPEHMLNMGMRPPQINNAKATLGRVLFYDTRLSKNQTVSCASCHKQEIAFSDDKALSEGFDGELTFRNSLALGSVPNFQSSYDGSSTLSGTTQLFFWDERAHSIKQQSTFSIQDNIEMGMNMSELTARLREVDYYEILFRKAYGNPAINEEKITDALEEFVLSLVSTHSRFDDGMASVSGNEEAVFSSFTQRENLGKSLFIQHCSNCHGSNMSTAPENIANNGLDLYYEDNGVGDISSRATDNGKFKVPFLRNIALTGPYMHDGRFATLEEVVEHYNSGVKNHQNLDFRLKNGAEPRKLNLSDLEKQALVDFLHTLTDDEIVSDDRYADPF
jgi:cytochrome c peroxidase